jgi:hypothetical protein
MATQLKGVPISPLTGVLDVRSEPDNMEAGSLRYRGNLQTVNAKTLRRGCGWSKLLSQPAYNNTDLHDQLLQFGGSTREPVTMLQEVESSAKVRSVFSATQSRVLALREYSGNWQVIGWGFGGGAGTDCSGPRFQCDILGDYVIFTNGYDNPMYHIIEQAPNQDGSLLSQLPDLNLIGVATARKVWVWNNVVFLADVVMDGQKLSYRLVWSDYNSPLSFDPSLQGTISGFYDLSFGETILGGKACSSGFIIYTNQRMWLMSVNQSTDSNAPPFVFVKLPGTTPQVCLFYENTLVDVGDGHVYAGRDRLYYYNQWIGVPEPLEWVHLADAVAYESIRSDVCGAHVAVYHNNNEANEILVSFLTANSTNGCPDITLRINRTYKTVDIIDAGFSAFCTHRPQSSPTVRDLLVTQDVCSLYALDEEGFGFIYEGLPNPLPVATVDTPPNSIVTTVPLYIAAGLYAEDPDGAIDPNSLCSRLEANPSLLDCAGCDPNFILIGASSQDWCLKQIGDVFCRERCTNPTAVGTTGEYGYTSAQGTYLLDGYDSIIRFAPAFAPEMLVQAVKLVLSYLPAPGTDSTISLRIGISGQVADPNTDNCLIKWFTLSAKQLKCLNELTLAEYEKKNAVPNTPLEWNFLYTGKYLYFELKISGTGGDTLLGGVNGQVKTIETRNF